MVVIVPSTSLYAFTGLQNGLLPSGFPITISIAFRYPACVLHVPSGFDNYINRASWCSGNAFGLYSGGGGRRFEIRPGFCLYWERVFVCFLCHPNVWIILDWEKTLLPSKSFQVHYSSIILALDAMKSSYWQHRKNPLPKTILSHVWVTIDGVWIDNWIYWPLIHRNYK
jgi:hypothetical protein